ncbi:MAG: hypothetical protein R2749_10375 [Acidimicrobiales bacterium]
MGMLDRHAHRPGHGHPPAAGGLGGGGGGHPFGHLAELVVGLDDEGGEQFVATAEVAVERRGHHPQLSGLRPQRDALGPGSGQLGAGGGEDLGAHLGPGPGPGVADHGHGRSLADRCAISRALLLTLADDYVFTDHR